MTSICAGGGPSQAKADSPVLVSFTVAAIEVLLTEFGLPWLIPFVYGYSSPVIDTATFCTTDPPSQPFWTADDLSALLTPWLHPTNVSEALSKLDDQIKRIAWYKLCECSSGTQPTPPSGPAAPSGSPTVIDADSGVCVPMLAGQTRVLDLWTGSANASAPTGWDTKTFDDSAWPVGKKALTSTGAPAPLDAGVHEGIVPNCPDDTACRPEAVAPWTYPAGGHHNFVVRWRFTLPSFSPQTLCVRLHNAFGTGGSGGWSTGLVAINGGSQFVAFNSLSWQAHVTDLVVGENLIAIWVNSSNTGAGADVWGAYGGIGVSLTDKGAYGGNSQQGCCPPDPRVIQMLQQLTEQVQLIQRQAVPFGYVEGDNWIVSGQGYVDISGLLGMSIAPLSIPASVGVDDGFPDQYWLDSWINWGNSEGWTTREFLRTSPHVSFPSLAGQFTYFGYSLRPGLTVILQALVREP